MGRTTGWPRCRTRCMAGRQIRGYLPARSSGRDSLGPGSVDTKESRRLSAWHRCAGVLPYSSGVNAPQSKSSINRKEQTAAEFGLLLYPENPVLCRLGDSEFDDGLGWNLDLLLRLWIEACTCLPLLLHQLAKTGQDEFAVLFNLFVCERAERLEEYSSGSFVGLSGSTECDLKFSLGHV